MESGLATAKTCDRIEMERAYALAREVLLSYQCEEGYWVGNLSSSALSTATAVSALCAVGREKFPRLIRNGVAWLAADQNADGGWGDTPDSPSNLSTSLLVNAALSFADADVPQACQEGCSRYLAQRGCADGRGLVRALEEVYGADRTFAVPILTNAALAGMAGSRYGLRVEWTDVPPLPFELACVPRPLFRWLRLQVVSYALPALIAIGHAIHHHRPSRNPVRRTIRSLAVGPALRRLLAIQPESGGYLEAVPLTSFVVMSLAGAGQVGHRVVDRGVQFIQRLARPDGSWPIDSNLSVWLTTMAASALCAGGRDAGPRADATREWLANRQQQSVHPYTGARAGGWGWTHLPGSVPDVDDTSGALLALRRVGAGGATGVAGPGVRWLLGLQNADGGWPTFCRGWGKLPFDRSAPDLTAHALRALQAWQPGGRGVAWVVRRGFDYFRRTQRGDGSWVPLWFGNQAAPGQENPVYGTARVLAAYGDAGRGRDPEALQGLAYLLGAQNADGGWGGAAGVASSVEETAIAVESLARWGDEARGSVEAGARYLTEGVASGGLDSPTPIGLYFASLWYSERLYPVIWTVAALGRLLGDGARGARLSGREGT